MKTCVRAKVTGRVQGVGFRPTVFRYATQFGLCGYVCNTPQGVIIEVEGEELIVGAFFHQLASAPPKQALISEFQKEVCDSKGYKRFEVVESEPDGDPAVHITPDLATCDDCLRELFDMSNRRNGHAFINCTDCGPRFTIVRDLPYDRDRTSMSKFPMCEPCDHEYHNPRDRRFHAQPNACQRCGPQLRLRVASGRGLNDLKPLVTLVVADFLLQFGDKRLLGRSRGQSLEERADIEIFAFDLDHHALGRIAHVTAKPELRRVTKDGRSEPDSLDTAGHSGSHTGLHPCTIPSW